MPLTTVDQGLLSTNAQYTGFKNRIINGDMVIAQRGTGAFTVNDAAVYTVDRWFGEDVTDGAFTVQQVADAPAGFSFSARITITTADTSLAAGQYAVFVQRIEGFNTADLAFGTADASPITLSFRVKSSLTGTFGGVVSNGAENYSYPFTYTISAANTWETKTVSIPGATAGTWVGATNGRGMVLGFSLGSGSNFTGPAGAWAAADDRGGATGQTNIIGTLNATWQVTGVQIERGQTATSFDVLPYGTELALCQRYFCKSFPQTVVPANNVAVDQAINGFGGRIQVADVMGFRSQQYFFPVTMRVTPSITMFNPLGASGTGSYFTENNLTQNPASPGPYVTSEYNFGVWQYTGVTVGSTGTLVMVIFHYTASAEL